jgi:allantoinase
VDLELLIRAPRVVSGGRGEPEQAQAIGVSNGCIEVLQPVDTPATARTVLELGSDVVVLPGLIDPHVHVCEPGHTDWEGFAAATRAAAAGGVTTLVDMPLDSLPVTVTAPVTPYAGRRLQGVVRSTILRGEVVDGKRPRGKLLARHAA